MFSHATAANAYSTAAAGLLIVLFAIRRLLFAAMQGHRLFATSAMRSNRSESGNVTQCGLYVTGLPSSATQEQVEHLFGKYGNIKSVRLPPSKYAAPVCIR